VTSIYTCIIPLLGSSPSLLSLLPHSSS
jgi:hypothetical protein